MSLALAPPPEPAIHSEATWPYPPTHPSAGPLTAPPAPPPHARRCRGCTLNGIMSLDVGYKLVVNPTIDPTIEMGTRHEGGRNVGYPCIVGLLGRTHQEPPCIGSLQGATCSLGCVCSLFYGFARFPVFPPPLRKNERRRVAAFVLNLLRTALRLRWIHVEVLKVVPWAEVLGAVPHTLL